jgi:cyclohexyl-isocyanide hydratase
VNRREFGALSMGAVALAAVQGHAPAAEQGGAFAALRSRPVDIGMLLFERMDQIDFTGPFCILSRLPDSSLQIIGLTAHAVKDHKGLILTPQVALASARPVDVLVIPGGPGQEALMEHRELLGYIASHVAAGKVLFSVCTGALICGAAGVLRGRRATTHWASFELLPLFGAIAVQDRVVVDGNLVTAAGVTAGIDGALRLAALLRGDAAAQRIQLDVQYAPEPPYSAGSPHSAPPEVLDAVRAVYRPLTEARRATARRFAVKAAR